MGEENPVLTVQDQQGLDTPNAPSRLEGEEIAEYGPPGFPPEVLQLLRDPLPDRQVPALHGQAPAELGGQPYDDVPQDRLFPEKGRESQPSQVLLCEGLVKLRGPVRQPLPAQKMFGGRPSSPGKEGPAGGTRQGPTDLEGEAIPEDDLRLFPEWGEEDGCGPTGRSRLGHGFTALGEEISNRVAVHRLDHCPAPLPKGRWSSGSGADEMGLSPRGLYCSVSVSSR